MRWSWITFIAGLTFFGSAILLTPAPLLFGWMAPHLPQDLRLNGAVGTLSSGRLASVMVRERVVLSDAQWTLRWPWLLLLRLTADVETGGETVMRTRVSRTPFGPLRLQDLDALTSVRSLLGATGQPVLPVDGQTRLDLDQLVLDNGWPSRADGSLEVRGLAWALARDPVQLGDYTAALATDDQGIVAALADDGGPLELSGEARLRPDRQYDLRLQMRPRETASPALKELLRSAGRPDVQGWTHIRQQGTFAP